MPDYDQVVVRNILNSSTGDYDWEVVQAPDRVGFSPSLTDLLGPEVFQENGEINLKGYVYHVTGYDWINRSIIADLVSRP